MKYFLIIVSLFGSLLQAQCDDQQELQCGNDDNCEWIEDIETGYCGSHNTASSCPNYPSCSWSCDGCWYLGECCGSYICSGGYYQIDNSFCEEIEILECSEMNQLQCIQDSSCGWVQDIEMANCYNLSWDEQECLSNGCNYSCTSYYGCWCSGEYEINNSYCEEVNFMLGDTNGDGYLNVIDVVMIVDLILNAEYDIYADINQDDLLNVMDVVELLSIILDN